MMSREETPADVAAREIWRVAIRTMAPGTVAGSTVHVEDRLPCHWICAPAPAFGRL